jgi:hypothetical protein
MDGKHSPAFNEKIEPEWFKWVVHKQGSSIRKLGADKDIGKTERTIRRALKTKSMRPELLGKIAKKLDVHPDYLAGRFAWTLNLDIMREEGVREYWLEHFLDPKSFPYRLVEQHRIGSYKHLLETLLIHNVTEGVYKELNWDQRRKLENDLDLLTTRLLLKWFPEHARRTESLEEFEALEWKDEQDVIEAMLDYLEERGLVGVYVPESNPEDDDPFFEKYKDIPIAE